MGSLTRTKGFARAKDVEASEDGKPKVYTFRANDAEFDRYQDRNKVSGWKLENFNANPVILWMHDDASGGMFGSASDRLPIGRGRAYVEGDALMVDIEFDQGDEFAKQIEGKVERGILNAVSVRYRLTPGKYVENERGGIDSDEQELLEISVVVIPGNQRAVRVKADDDRESAIVERIAAAVVKALDAKRSAETEAPPAPTAPAEQDPATAPEATAATNPEPTVEPSADSPVADPAPAEPEAEPLNVDALKASLLAAFSKGLTQ